MVPPPAADPDAAAESIGRFRITRPCPVAPGEAPAFVAFDPERAEQVVLQLVAVPHGQSVGAALFRLKADVEASAKLGHPALVKARTLGVDEQRGPYLVREFVDGLSLRALPKMEVDLDAALHLLVQVALALAAADEAGVAPRTLRLEHVFVAPNGQVRLQVFGLAHADAPSSAASAHQLARAGLELILGALAFAEAAPGDAPPRLPAALDQGLARAFGKALAAEPSERFPSVVAFMQVLIGEAPLPEPKQHALLELIDRRAPVLEDGVVADWIRGIWRGPAAVDTSVTAPIPIAARAPGPQRPEPVEAPETPAAAAPKKRGSGLLIVAAIVLLALAAGGYALFGARKPLVVRVDSVPPGATLQVDGHLVGETPIDVTDPAPGARARLSRPGFKPAEASFRAGEPVLTVSLEPLPPPPEPPPAASPPPPPAQASAPVEPPAEPERTAKPPPEPRHRPEPQRPEARPARPAAKAPASEKEKRQFDLFKHLEKQTPGP